MKKTIAFLALTLLSISKGLAYVTINGINYNLDWSAKTATVTQCWLLTGDITIPNTIVSGTTSFNVTVIEQYLVNYTFNRLKINELH